MVLKMQTVKIKLYQNMVNYRKEMSFGYVQTYPLPTPSMIKGMIHAILGLREYHNLKISIQGNYDTVVTNMQKIVKFDKSADPIVPNNNDLTAKKYFIEINKDKIPKGLNDYFEPFNNKFNDKKKEKFIGDEKFYQLNIEKIKTDFYDEYYTIFNLKNDLSKEENDNLEKLFQYEKSVPNKININENKYQKRINKGELNDEYIVFIENKDNQSYFKLNIKKIISDFYIGDSKNKKFKFKKELNNRDKEVLIKLFYHTRDSRNDSPYRVPVNDSIKTALHGIQYVDQIVNMNLILHILFDEDELNHKLLQAVQENLIVLGRNEDIARVDEVKLVDYYEYEGESDYSLKNNIYLEKQNAKKNRIQGTHYRLPFYYRTVKSFKDKRIFKFVDTVYVTSGRNLKRAIVDDDNDMVNFLSVEV